MIHITVFIDVIEWSQYLRFHIRIRMAVKPLHQVVQKNGCDSITTILMNHKSDIIGL